MLEIIGKPDFFCPENCEHMKVLVFKEQSYSLGKYIGKTTIGCEYNSICLHAYNLGKFDDD